MAADKRLTTAPTLTPDPGPPYWVDTTQDKGGKLPCRVKWGKPTGSFAPEANGDHYPCLVGIDQFKSAVPYILGFSATGGANGTLIRSKPPYGALPIADPDGRGMFAVRIASFHYVGDSGIKADDNSQIDFFGPNSADRAWNYNEAVAKQQIYVLLDVEFRHLKYTIATDDQVAVSLTSPTPLGERLRFCYATYQSSIEYLTLDKGTMDWGPDRPPDASGATKVGFGIGITQPVGELVVNWYDIPANGVTTLLNKWETAEGRVNVADFTVQLAGGYKTYKAGTLMVLAPRLIERYQPTGFLSYDVVYTFANRRFGNSGFVGPPPVAAGQGWNYFFDPTSPPPGAYYSVQTAARAGGGGGVRPYLTTDFEDLFKC